MTNVYKELSLKTNVDVPAVAAAAKSNESKDNNTQIQTLKF